MRLLTWNCCHTGTFDQQLALIESLNYDVAVLQECARPTSTSETAIWFGDDPRQGIAVIAKPPYRLQTLPHDTLERYVIPLQVRGPNAFLLFAVWTLPNPTYIEPLFRTAERYADRIRSEETVMLGDFNSNAIWNKKHQPARDHGGLVDYLAKLGLVSAYHHFSHEEHGSESQPTFYWQWNQHDPFHIDYCFLPDAWAAQVQHVEIGNYADWQTLSDHRPLVVDLAFPI